MNVRYLRALPSSVGSASNHRNPYKAIIGVFDRTSGLEKPRDLAEWRPWGRKRTARTVDFRARLHAGYTFATSLWLKPVYAGVRRFKNRSGAGFLHFRQLG